MSDWAHLTSLTTCQGLHASVFSGIFVCSQSGYHSFFSSEVSPNFDLKNMISTFTKDLPWEKNGPNSPDFEGFFFHLAIFSAISSNK
jgi:hypothetical protein